MKVNVDIRFTYDLPDDPQVRLEMYGTDDIAECVLIDLENDPAAFLLEVDMDVIGVSE